MRSSKAGRLVCCAGQVLECHVFICKSADAGIALVQATSYAFEHREGWLSDGSPPPAPVGSSMMFGGSVCDSPAGRRSVGRQGPRLIH